MKKNIKISSRRLQLNIQISHFIIANQEVEKGKFQENRNQEAVAGIRAKKDLEVEKEAQAEECKEENPEAQRFGLCKESIQQVEVATGLEKVEAKAHHTKSL